MSTPARVLIVDDDAAVRRSYGRVLTRAGMMVLEAPDTEDAITILRSDAELDVLVSDYNLPTGTGLDLLAKAQQLNPDLPVLIMTGMPTVDTAVRALERGAIRFLTKPINADEFCDTVNLATRHRRSLAEGRANLERLGCAQLRGDSELNAALDRALAGLHMVFQPLVDSRRRTRFGYEALVRSSEASLPNPPALLEAAERLGRLRDVGRAIRNWVANALAQTDASDQIFVNLHPADLEDDELYDPNAPLSQHASRVILELTERAALEEVDAVSDRVMALRAMGFRIAVDDLGAGYSSLSSLVQLAPEVVKLDISLVRGVATHPLKSRLVQSMVGVCHDIGSLVVAEGVEDEADRDTVVALDSDLLQGWRHGRPAWPFPAHTW
jgi:EAL domain-containing protein (putative c-di-GMP-specific phosphodiesterase class I)